MRDLYGARLQETGSGEWTVTAPRPRDNFGISGLGSGAGGGGDAQNEHKCPSGADIDAAKAAINAGSRATGVGLIIVAAGGTAIWVSQGVWPQVNQAGAVTITFGAFVTSVGGLLGTSGGLYMAARGDPRQGVYTALGMAGTSRMNPYLQSAGEGLFQSTADYLMDLAGWPECQ